MKERRKNKIKCLLVIVVIILAYSAAAEARVLGTVGATYPFAEKDALSEIEHKARGVNWNKAMAGLRSQGNNLVPASVPKLPVAATNRRRQVDPTYVLDESIPDPRTGGILYPKGYRFNPLNYAPFPGEVVVFNAADRRQLNWFSQSVHAKQLSSVVLLTGGNPKMISEMVGRAVYFADDKLTKRLGVRAVPSVVRQRNKMYEVEEFNVNNKKPIAAHTAR